jgi:hypothetical protein
MATRLYRYGSSSEVFATVRSETPADRDPTRLSTSLHMTAQPVAQAFRVVAELAEGGTALVCLGASRVTAVAEAHGRARAFAEAVRLRLERWSGTACAGRWEKVRTAPGELPRVHGRRRRRRPVWRR